MIRGSTLLSALWLFEGTVVLHAQRHNNLLRAIDTQRRKVTKNNPSPSFIFPHSPFTLPLSLYLRDLPRFPLISARIFVDITQQPTCVHTRYNPLLPLSSPPSYGECNPLFPALLFLRNLFSSQNLDLIKF